MGKAIFTMDDSEFIFDDVSMDDLSEFIEIKADSADYESEVNKESLEDMCKTLGLNSISVENKLETIFKKRYGKDAEKYLRHII